MNERRANELIPYPGVEFDNYKDCQGCNLTTARMSGMGFGNYKDCQEWSVVWQPQMLPLVASYIMSTRDGQASSNKTASSDTQNEAHLIGAL